MLLLECSGLPHLNRLKVGDKLQLRDGGEAHLGDLSQQLM